MTPTLKSNSITRRNACCTGFASALCCHLYNGFSQLFGPSPEMRPHESPCQELIRSALESPPHADEHERKINGLCRQKSAPRAPTAAADYYFLNLCNVPRGTFGLFNAYRSMLSYLSFESRGRAESTLMRKSQVASQVRLQVANQIAMCKLSCLSQAEQLSKVRQPGLQEVRPGMLMLHRRWERASLEGCIGEVPTHVRASQRTMHARLAGKNSATASGGSSEKKGRRKAKYAPTRLPEGNGIASGDDSH